MRETYRFMQAPSIHSASGRQKFIEDRLALGGVFARDIQPFIDRVNRSGAGLVMAIDDPDAATRRQAVRFHLKSAKQHEVQGTLKGDMLFIYETSWGGRDDFRRLVPRLVRDLVVMASDDLLARQPPAALP